MDYSSKQAHLLKEAHVCTVHCYACSIRLLQPVSFFCAIVRRRPGNVSSGDTRSRRKGSCGSDIALSPGCTGSVGGEDVNKTLCYNRQRPPPLSMTRRQSCGGPSAIGSFHRALPKCPSGARVCQLPANPAPPPPTVTLAAPLAVASWECVQEHFVCTAHPAPSRVS